jgi:diguanylate cyclase (GGDEF)-like protein
MPDVPGWTADRALAALLEALDEAVLVFDEFGLCRVGGRRVAELFGLDPAAVVGLPRRELLARIAATLKTGEVLRPLDHEPRSHDRTVVDPIEIDRPHPRTVVWTSVPLELGGAEQQQAPLAGRLDLIRDVTRERRAEAAVEELGKRLELVTTIDDLTGLANRRRFEEECLREHRRAQREWISYAVARVDVDGMTAINQSLGAAVGDELLKRLGDELKSARREYDVVARWMNDEFILLLPRADALAAAKVLKRAIAGVHARGREIAPGMSVSVGAAVWTPPSGEGSADIIRRAGDALASARARGQGKLELDAGVGEWKDEPTSGT